MFRVENREVIENLKNELLKINSSIDFNSVTIQLTLNTIDSLFTRLHKAKKMELLWSKKIKPQKLEVLSSEINYLKKQIEKETAELERESIFLQDIELNTNTEQANLNMYDMAKRWSTSSVKNLDKLYRRYADLSETYFTLQNDSSIFTFDYKGNIVSKNTEYQDILEKILLNIRANIDSSISIEKLKRIALDDDEESDF
ncbi:Hypothetical protein MAGb_3250 [Mycoplasmopsis agalactiae 14628]|uniref:Uncharacterized protein n=1 Tax=Mycoplasmopsis agalactiae 14628 TaxID=1110504 RepID=I5D6A7_MYCAA|nr:hypothetical protein [Mycoplasmopsis agalactiae]EIN15216.1 Hypothetical protein MAGb_3250 [Mycoplasmopsis agalactiae 14628]